MKKIMNSNEKCGQNQGFSLIELIIAIAILVILTGVLAPQFLKYIEKSRAAVCESNRDTLLKQIIFEQVMNPSYGVADLSDREKNACPSKETYIFEFDKNENRLTITCPVHSSTTGGIGDIDLDTSQEFILDFNDFVKKQVAAGIKSNDVIRKKFLEYYNGKWPVLKVGGKEYSIQPFYKQSDQSTTSNISDRIWLFARVDSSSAPGWNTGLVYNVLDGKWYQAVKEDGKDTGVSMTKYNDIQDLNKDINSNYSNGKPKWVEVKDYTESLQ